MPPTFLSDLLLQSLPYLFGSGGLILWFLERQKNKALTGQEIGKSTQENAKGKQEEVTALNNFSDVFDKISKQFNVQFDKMQGKIDDLENKLDDYVQQCTQCPNNKLK